MSTILDLDALMDEKLESVEAAAEFVDPPNGVHNFRVVKLTPSKREAKDKEKARAEGRATEWLSIKLTYEILNTVECEGLPPKPGSLSSEDFSFTEQGKPYFKSRMLAIFAANGIGEEDYNGLTLGEQAAFIEQEAVVFQATTKENTRTMPDGNTFTSVRYSNVVAVDE